MKKPWFPAYAYRWLSSETFAAFSHAQQGVFWNLLCRCWLGPDCSLPSDVEELKRLTGYFDDDISTVIKRGFVKHPVNKLRITSPQLYAEFERANGLSKTRSKAAKSRYEKQLEFPDTSEQMQSKPSAFAEQTLTSGVNVLKNNQEGTVRKGRSRKDPKPPPEGLVPIWEGCTWFRLSQDQFDKALTKYESKGLTREHLETAIEQNDIWLAGETAAARAARRSPTHYHRLGAAYTMELIHRVGSSPNQAPRGSKPGFTPGQTARERGNSMLDKIIAEETEKERKLGENRND